MPPYKEGHVPFDSQADIGGKLTCAGTVQRGAREFQPSVQHFSESGEQHADAASVTCSVWYVACTRDTTQLLMARQHVVVSSRSQQTDRLEGQSRRTVPQTTHSAADRFDILP